MSVQETTQQEQQTTQATSQAEGQTTQTDGATQTAEGQGQTTQAEGQTAATNDADKAAQEARERDDKGRFKGVQPRIDELTRARREAEREAAYWKAVANGKGEGSAEQAAKEKPTPDKFDDYGAYVEALTDWKADQVVSKRMSERAQAQQQEVRTTTWNERQAAARTAMPDYDEVVGSSETPLAPHVAEVILESDHGPALAYHFARNPEVLTRLNGMSPLQAAREVGRIETSLASPTTQTAASTVKTTNAPKPATTTASQGRTTSSDPSKMSMDEYRKFRAGQGARWAR